MKVTFFHLQLFLTIPTGIFGVFAFTGLAGIDNNIYVQVGLIMLVGLLAKNAILIVEFAVQRRKAGRSLIESALQASRLRLRPILMTSLPSLWDASIGLDARRICKRKSFYWLQYCRGNVDRSCIWDFHYSGNVCCLPVSA
jgi:hypothetical protein